MDTHGIHVDHVLIGDMGERHVCYTGCYYIAQRIVCMEFVVYHTIRAVSCYLAHFFPWAVGLWAVAIGKDSCYLAQLFRNGLWPCGQWPLAKVAQFF